MCSYNYSFSINCLKLLTFCQNLSLYYIVLFVSLAGKYLFQLNRSKVDRKAIKKIRDHWDSIQHQKGKFAVSCTKRNFVYRMFVSVAYIYFRNTSSLEISRACWYSPEDIPTRISIHTSPDMNTIFILKLPPRAV